MITNDFLETQISNALATTGCSSMRTVWRSKCSAMVEIDAVGPRPANVTRRRIRIEPFIEDESDLTHFTINAGVCSNNRLGINILGPLSCDVNRTKWTNEASFYTDLVSEIRARFG